VEGLLLLLYGRLIMMVCEGEEEEEEALCVLWIWKLDVEMMLVVSWENGVGG
jgi:hypothetical protein